MTTVTEVEAPQGTQMAYGHLRALHTAEQASWFQVVASDLPRGRHTLAYPEDGERTLWRPEPTWYSVGAGDANGGHGGQVLAAASEPVPELLTLSEAGAMIPALRGPGVALRHDGTMGYEAVDDAVQAGLLYALYGHKRTKHVFRAQVSALALDRRAQALRAAGDEAGADRLEAAWAVAASEWSVIRGLLPNPGAAQTTVEPLPSPEPLPVTGGTEPRKWLRALLIAHELEWLVYEHPVDDGYLVHIGGIERVVPGVHVKEYVLAVGDYRGEGRRVAYRDELG